MNHSGKINWLFNKDQIIETVLRFSHSMDTRDWKMLRECLCEEIKIDYSDFRGTPQRTISADEFVLSKTKGLEKLTTQHFSTNHIVEIQGNKATCKSSFIIYRAGFNKNGEKDFLNSQGIYVHSLRLKNGEWLIEMIVQKIYQTDGNHEIHGAFRKNIKSD